MKNKPANHVLWLASWYPHKNNNLLGNFIARQAEAVNRFKKVTVLYATQHIESEYIIKVSQEPTTVVRVYFPQTNNSLIKFLRYIRAWKKGYQYIIKNIGKPQIIHLNVMYPAGIFALFLTKLYKIPLVITEHWTGYSFTHTKISFFQRIVIKYCLAHARSIFVYSSHLEKKLQKFGRISNVHYLPNVVNTDFFIPPQYQKPKLSPFRLIHISTCDDKQKNISGIIRSLSILREKTNDFSIDIIGGEENDHQPLKILSKNLNLDSHIHFHTTKTHADLLSFLQKAHVFVLFSHYEGLPCVLLEAMSVGVPVISTETGGLFSWIDEKNGKLIKIGDEQALAEGIFEMMTHYERYNPILIRQKIVETCSYNAVAKTILNCYTA